MNIEELEQLYQQDQDFREYIAKWQRKKTPYESRYSLYTLSAVKEYAEWLIQSKKGRYTN